MVMSDSTYSMVAREVAKMIRMGLRWRPHWIPRTRRRSQYLRSRNQLRPLAPTLENTVIRAYL